MDFREINLIVSTTVEELGTNDDFVKKLASMATCVNQKEKTPVETAIRARAEHYYALDQRLREISENNKGQTRQDDCSGRIILTETHRRSSLDAIAEDSAEEEALREEAKQTFEVGAPQVNLTLMATKLNLDKETLRQS